MASVEAHYAQHLAPVYVWMAGGLDAALAQGTQDLAGLLPGSGLALDLGAGFGMHSIPLARAGYEVMAVDSSAALLEVLRTQGAGLPIQVVHGELTQFQRWLAGPAQLILCMGDTLPHLSTEQDLERLCQAVGASLAPAGRFIATFRDYSVPAAPRRFIPVRSDPERILTCALDTSESHVEVHDLIHEREGEHWNLKVSSYRKLRLAPQTVASMLHKGGLRVRIESGPRGMVKLSAQRED